MKIGIMTFPNSTSFGAALQMYALYRAVNKLGGSAQIINYHNSYMKKGKHTALHLPKAPVKQKMRQCVRQLMHFRQIAGFRRFEKAMSQYPAKPFTDPKRLVQIGKRYDGIICGSDQVWNPDITDCDMSYFLDFCTDNTKRIAYAPSFGISDFSTQFRQMIRQELEKFSHISVREAEGQQMLEQLLGQKITLVQDPTFLISRQEWMDLEKAHPAAKEPYILYYTITKSPALLQFAKQLAERKKLKLVVIGGNMFKRSGNGNVTYACDIDPRQWLYLIHHAQCVVTNSFHGTAFSINYQKDFYLEFSSRTNSRLEHIIRTAGLEERIVRDGSVPQDGSINYQRVTPIFEAAREQSEMYLRGAIAER